MLLDNYYQLRTQSDLTDLTGKFLIDLSLTVNTSSGDAFALTSNECSGPDRLIRTTDNSHIKTNIPVTEGIESNYRYIVFGDGNVPVSTEDYSISGSVIGNITISSIEGIRTVTGHKIMYTFKYTGTNTAVIKEVCIFDNFASSVDSISYGRKVALWREVFDTPLQVPAGSMFTYNFEVKYT